MDSINEKQLTDTFPFETLRKLKNTVLQETDRKSVYSARSYDNRGRISDIAASLQSKLGYFQTRLASNSFLSDTFSWQVKTAITSDPDRLLAKAGLNAQAKDFSIKVDGLATIRTAISKKLDSDDAALFKTGTYSYILTIGSMSHDIDVDVENEINNPATNRSVLLDLERSINKLGVDVKARLHDKKTRDYNPYRENAYKDISWLSIASVTTGDDIEFSLSDTNGDLIKDLSLDRVTTFGHRNRYYIDGSQDKSNLNEITIETDKVTGYLLGTTDSDANLQVTVKKGKIELAAELTNIINDYNELISWIDDNSHVISPNLKTALFQDLSTTVTNNKTVKSRINGNTFNASNRDIDLASAINLNNANSFNEKLQDIGLTLNNDGTLDVGEDFSTSVSSNLRDVYDTLAGTNGFFSKISTAMETIYDRDESNYVFSFNSVLSYDSNGTNRQSIYKSNSSNIISLFA